MGNQAYIADIFEVERAVITKYIRNIHKDKELDAASVCVNLHILQKLLAQAKTE
jgi:hypothetical protein